MDITKKTQHYDRLLDPKGFNLLQILANRYPETVEDYAVQLLYVHRGHSFFTITEIYKQDKENKYPFENTNEIVYIVSENVLYKVNVRTGKIFSKEL